SGSSYRTPAGGNALRLGSVEGGDRRALIYNSGATIVNASAAHQTMYRVAAFQERFETNSVTNHKTAVSVALTIRPFNSAVKTAFMTVSPRSASAGDSAVPGLSSCVQAGSKPAVRANLEKTFAAGA